MASASGKDISLYQGHGHATTTAPKHPERIDWPAAPSRLLEQAQDGKKLELSGGSFLQAKGGLIMGLAELLPASKALQASLGDLLESALARPGAFPTRSGWALECASVKFRGGFAEVSNSVIESMEFRVYGGSHGLVGGTEATLNAR